MRYEAELFKASVSLANGMFFRALTRYDVSLLQRFYCSLNQEERRVRFGGAVSDEAIASYCEQIEWRSTLLIGLGDPNKLIAVSTNVRVDSRRVENATVASAEGQQAISTLLRLSAVASGELFAADRMLVNLEGARWLLHHLGEIGPVTVSNDYADLDVRSVAGTIVSGDARGVPRHPQDETNAAVLGVG